MTLPLPRHGPGAAARTALFEALTAGGDEAVALLAGGRGDTPILGAEWTVAEAAAHLATANELMAALAAGEQRPYGDGTPGSLAERPRRDTAVLAGEIARWAPSSPRRAPSGAGGSGVPVGGSGPDVGPLGRVR